MTPSPDTVPRLRHDVARCRLGDEEVVWSPIRRRPVALDAVTSLMLDVIDGVASTGDLARDVADVVGLPLDDALGRVRQVLARLDGAGALVSSPGDPVNGSGADHFLAAENP